MTFITREELAREEVELLPSRDTLLSAAAASANQAVLVSQS